MGVTGLAALIKATEGSPATGLKDKQVEVDSMSLFFGLLKTKSYYGFEKDIKANARLQGKRSMSAKDAPSKRPRLSECMTSRNDNTDVSNTPEASSKALDTDTNAPYKRIAHRIDAILTTHMDKSTTTLHWDGAPSIEKSTERANRQKQVDEKLAKLDQDVTKAIEKKGSAPARLYHECKSLFRPSRDILDVVKAELSIIGWTVCNCEYQADTHIAQVCQQATDKDKIEVISGDSDLLTYEHIPRIIMPVGRKHELTVFSKEKLLESLSLPSPRHLLVTSLVTKNDYFGGFQGMGVKRNAGIIRKMPLAIDRPLEQVVREAIDTYLATIESDKNIETFTHAISAFVLVQEQGSPRAVPSAVTHDRIGSFLTSLEEHRRNRKLRTNPQQGGHPQHQQEQHPNRRKRRRKHRPRNRSRKKKARKPRRQKASHWERSKFKSRNADCNPRYSPHTVRDVSKAEKVKDQTLRTLTIDEPRRPTKAPNAASDISNATTPATTSLTGKEIKLGKRTEGDGAAPLKTLYKKTFATVTLTLGSIAGCLKRATDLSADDANQVASQIETAADILTNTRIWVYKCIELFLISRLQRMAMDLEQEPDHLDLILDRKHSRKKCDWTGTHRED
ncbi:hypothetical protein B0O80DRAFT_134092 [Mortierella sp. GBAus27b]|nr:hypothetical protein B0O80DRAFT_134092 [Mortierella sp. GBAus27b]